MNAPTTQYTLKQTRAVEAYDVIQVLSEQGNGSVIAPRWLDLMTLRSAEDIKIASDMVANDKEHEYRIVSMNKRDVVVERVVAPKAKRLTIASVRETVRSFGLTMSTKRNSAGDFRINFPGGGEATAFYSNDLDEIVGTAKSMGDELVAFNAQRDRDVAELKAQQDKHIAGCSKDVYVACGQCGEHVDDGAEFCTRHRAEINERLTIADVAALRRPYSVEQADARLGKLAIAMTGVGALSVDDLDEHSKAHGSRPYDEDVAHAETLAYGRAESYMRPLGAARVVPKAIAFTATEHTFTCFCGHRVHASREAIDALRVEGQEQTDAEIVSSFETCLRCATGSADEARLELHAIGCPLCAAKHDDVDDARERGVADDVDALLDAPMYTGAGASQVLADEYEESVDIDSDDASDDDFAEHDDEKLAGSMMDLLLDNRSDIEHLPAPIKHGETFRQAGTLTDDAGFVLTLANGTRVFVTIQVQ